MSVLNLISAYDEALIVEGATPYADFTEDLSVPPLWILDLPSEVQTAIRAILVQDGNHCARVYSVNVKGHEEWIVIDAHKGKWSWVLPSLPGQPLIDALYINLREKSRAPFLKRLLGYGRWGKLFAAIFCLASGAWLWWLCQNVLPPDSKVALAFGVFAEIGGAVFLASFVGGYFRQKGRFHSVLYR